MTFRNDRNDRHSFNRDRNDFGRKEPEMPDDQVGRNRPAWKNGRNKTCPCCQQPNKLSAQELAKGFVCEDCGE